MKLTSSSTISEANCKCWWVASWKGLWLISFPFPYDSIKPSLRKVSKYENKFAKLQKKAAEFNFRNQLKQVKKKEFTMEEEDKEVWSSEVVLYRHIFTHGFCFGNLQKKPDWSKKPGEGEKKVKDGEEGDSGAEDVKA